MNSSKSKLPANPQEICPPICKVLEPATALCAREQTHKRHENLFTRFSKTYIPRSRIAAAPSIWGVFLFFLIKVTRGRRYIFILRLHVRLRLIVRIPQGLRPCTSQPTIFHNPTRCVSPVGLCPESIRCAPVFWTQPLPFTLSYISHTQHEAFI